MSIQPISEAVEKQAISHTAGQNVKWYHPYGGNLALTNKITCGFTVNPAVPLVAIYPEDTHASVQKYICIRLFICSIACKYKILETS